MLEDWLVDYEKAIADKNWDKVARIEREMASLGVDKCTLIILVEERKKISK